MKWSSSALLSQVCFDEVLFSNFLTKQRIWFLLRIAGCIYDWKLLYSPHIRPSRRNWEFASYSPETRQLRNLSSLFFLGINLWAWMDVWFSVSSFWISEWSVFVFVWDIDSVEWTFSLDLSLVGIIGPIFRMTVCKCFAFRCNHYMIWNMMKIRSNTLHLVILWHIVGFSSLWCSDN